ncbi:hypothetical protein C0991_003820 [Blastosporella zonata]|nr:hypothetical protein C0991_003820 [Blastosporella zonata]
MIFLSGRPSRTPPRPPASIASNRVPSLASLCLRILARYPDQLPIDARRHLHPALDDVLDPTQRTNPTYWAVLVQLYDSLPADLSTLVLPLADADIPLLQRIQQTPLFSLLTVLDLPACPHLTDTSVVLLSPLHSLVALDASATSLSSYAIKVLAGTLLWADDGPLRRGPWPLRILRLRFCGNIDDAVYPHLDKFPLLTVIDLRGTQCRPPKDSYFQSCSARPELFHPAPLATAVDSLEGTDLYTSENAFKLVIDTLDHPPAPIPRQPHAFAESYTFKAPHKAVEGREDRKLTSALSIQCPTLLRMPSSPAPPNTSSESKHSFFYDLSRIRPPPQVTYDPINKYDAKAYYKWVHLEIIARPAQSLDSKLALYREPPPWSVLEERSAFLLGQTRARAPTQAAIHVASVNRTHKTFQIHQARIDALRESASVRRRSGVGTAASSRTPADKEAPGSVQGRNPFRRHSMPGISAVTAMGSSSSASGMRPLKPISAVEVPVLPLNLKAAVKTPMRLSTTASSSFMGAPVNKARAGAFHSTWSGGDQATLKEKRSRSVERTAVKKLRVEDVSGDEKKGKPRVNVEGSKKVKQGFDWSSWGVK